MIEIIFGLVGAVVLLFILWVMAMKQSAKDRARAEQAEFIIKTTKEIQKKNLELAMKQESEFDDKIIRDRRYFP